MQVHVSICLGHFPKYTSDICQNMCQIEYLAGSLEYVVFVFKKGEVHPMCTIVLFLQHISVNGIYDDSSNDDPQSYVTFPLPFPFPDAYA